MFFGNSRIILFNPSNDGSIPAARTATRVWYGDDENVYTDYEISGTIKGSDSSMGQEATTQIPRVDLAKKIEIGSTVTNIGEYAFANCNDLNEVIINNSVTSIGV